MKVQTIIKRISSAVRGGKSNFRYSSILDKQPLDRVKMEMKTLVSAVENALDPINSDRIDLLTVYENSWKDSQVIAEREKADSYLVTEPFEVLEGEKASREKTELLRRPWFNKFETEVMYSEFWGYTLIEFQEQDEKGEFCDVKVFPRKHVRPFEKIITLNPTDRVGIPYEGDEIPFYFLELGDPEELGKLETIAREIIWKTFARSDWSEYNERFGKPILDFGINTDNEDEIKEKAKMAEEFGANGWIIRDVDEVVGITQVASRASAENFETMARFCDEQISKLMNGQTGTSDEKSFVGSAEVHERVLDKFTEARLTRIQNIVNYKLFPFLTAHHYPLEGCKFQFTCLQPKPDKKQTDPHNPKEPPQPAQPDQPGTQNVSGKKKIKAPRLGYDYCGRVISLSALESEKEINFKRGVIEKAMDRLYETKKPTVVPREIWQAEYRQMLEGLSTGYGRRFSVRFGGKDWEYIQNLKYNTAVFDAFKANKEIKEAYRLLTDDSGNPRGWKEFKKEALQVAEKYNRRWLQTEYNQAHVAAKAAAKWQSYLRNIDLYPNLKYIAVMDERTRQSHARLNGKVFPIGHPFWDEYYPPNGWGCRCSVQQTDEKETPVREEDLPAVPPVMRNNVGKTAQVFNESHEYFQNMSEAEKDKIYYFVQQNIRPAKDIIQSRDQFISHGKDWKKDYFNGDNGGWLVTHRKRLEASTVSKNEKAKYDKEAFMCQAFSKSGYRIEHLPEQPGISSPDITINNEFADLKRVASHNNIAKYATKAINKQGAKYVLFQIDNWSEKVRSELNSLKRRGFNIKYFVTGEENRIHTL